MLRIYIITTFLVFSFVSIGYAVPVTWTIEGQVSYVHPELVGRFSIGAEFTSSLSFETDLSDAEPSRTNSGLYLDVASITATLDGYDAFVDHMYMRVIDNHEVTGRDLIGATTGPTDYGIGEDVGTFNFFGFSFHLRNDDGNMLTSIDLPELPPNPTLVDTEYLSMQFRRPFPPPFTSTESALVMISNLQINAVPAPVPEPSTFILLGGGLAALAFYRRKKK